MKNRAGFTLVEIMVVVAIFFVLAAAIFATLRMGRKSWQTGNVQVEMQQEVRKGLDSMIKELRQSTLNPPNAITVTASTVTFRIPASVDVNGNITWTANILYSVGGLNGSQLLRAQGGASTVLANNIQSFSPVLNGRVLTITLTAQKNTVFQRTLTATLTSQVTLRN